MLKATLVFLPVPLTLIICSQAETSLWRRLVLDESNGFEAREETMPSLIKK